jgi:opacity protein-like surface antigen
MPRALILLTAVLAALLLAAPAQAASVKGKWKGTVHIVKGGTGAFAMKMTITRTKVGAKAGTLSNPGSPCHGTLRVSSRLNGGYSLRYHELAAAGECTGDDRIFIRRKGARLSWRATSPDGRQVGKALLRRA